MMGMSLENPTIRWILYVINLLFVLTGIIIISVGVCINWYYKNYSALLQNQYVYLQIVLITIGFIIFAIAVLGWYGAAKESSFLTLMFSTFLLLIFFLEAAIGISGYLLRGNAEKALVQSLILPNMKVDSEAKNAWNNMQEDFRCCGIYAPDDWINLTTDNQLPTSCCTNTSAVGFLKNRRDFANCTLESHHLNHRGCFYKFQGYVRRKSFIIEVLGFTLAAFQLIGIAISCHLSCEFRKGYQTV